MNYLKMTDPTKSAGGVHSTVTLLLGFRLEWVTAFWEKQTKKKGNNNNKTYFLRLLQRFNYLFRPRLTRQVSFFLHFWRQKKSAAFLAGFYFFKRLTSPSPIRNQRNLGDNEKTRRKTENKRDNLFRFCSGGHSFRRSKAVIDRVSHGCLNWC